MQRGIQIGLLILLSVVSVCLVSCATAPAKTATPNATEVTIKDQLGRTVKINQVPKRIISLAPTNTEILFALELGNRVVGVTSYDDYPPEVKQKPVIGSYTTPDIEKIVFQKPDLILAIGRHAKDVIPQLEQRGLPVVATDPTSIEGILQAITLVGKITGQEAQAAGVVSARQNEIKTVTDLTGKLSDAQKPRTLYLTWADPLFTVGSGNLDDDIIRLAGGTNIAHDLPGTATITLEEIMQDNPQVIIAGIGMGNGADATLRFALTEPVLKATDARLYNRIYGIDINLAGRAGPRIAGVLRQFAQFIHPELFGWTENTHQ